MRKVWIILTYRVFVKKGCSVCKAVVAQLERKGIPFEKVDVSTVKGWDEAKALGVQHAGTILDENNLIVSLESLS